MIFCDSDAIALGALRAFLKKGSQFREMQNFSPLVCWIRKLLPTMSHPLV